MKHLTVAIDMEYDHTRVSPAEVVYNVREALEEWFNRYDVGYDQEGLRLREVRLYEDVTVVSPWDKRTS